MSPDAVVSTTEIVSLLEPIVLSIVAVLGGGQVYLWLRYVKLATDIATLKAIDDSFSKMLERIDETVADVQRTTHSIDTRMAILENQSNTSR